MNSESEVIDIMKFFRHLISALSMYSRIPMPRIDRRDDDGRGEDLKPDGARSLMFLPFVGAIIGVVMFLLVRLMSVLSVPLSVKGMAAVLVPLFITGGFHIDGYMDTSDALSSYAQRERKLEIMKDPHIGSFAVIRFAMLLLVMTGALTVLIGIETSRQIPVFILACVVFTASRALAALSSLYMKKAKDDGMLAKETEDPDTLCVVVLSLWMIASFALAAYIDVAEAGVMAAAFIVFTLYYRHITSKNFGGVTGDTAGYFVAASDTFVIFVLAVFKLIMTGLVK